MDYAALATSSEFAAFADAVRELQRTDPHASLTDPSARRCFFINLYNVLTVHAIAVSAASARAAGDGPLDSVLSVPHFWRRFAYDVGGAVFTLDDIEHGILRGAAVPAR